MENNFFELVGKNISNMLEQKKMTQQSLANLLGISKQVLNKIIKGQKAININEIAMISKVLDVSADTLMDVDLKAPALSPQFSFMGKIEKEATKEKFNMLRQVIEEILFLEEYADDH